jgi:hypothetical protein
MGDRVAFGDDRPGSLPASSTLVARRESGLKRSIIFAFGTCAKSAQSRLGIGEMVISTEAARLNEGHRR